MRMPLTLVPLVDPRSTITKALPLGRISVCLRLTLASGRAMVQSGRRPMVTSRSLSVTRSPDGSTSGRPERRRRPRADGEVTVKRPGLRLLSTVMVDTNRAHEVEALGAGVFAGGLAQLVVERLVDVGEAGVILGAELEAEVVGHDAPALDVDAAVVVHLAEQPPAELDRTNAGVRTT